MGLQRQKRPTGPSVVRGHPRRWLPKWVYERKSGHSLATFVEAVQGGLLLSPLKISKALERQGS